jgi:hypothetical protein
MLQESSSIGTSSTLDGAYYVRYLCVQIQELLPELKSPFQLQTRTGEDKLVATGKWVQSGPTK